jgi:endonuclease I
MIKKLLFSLLVLVAFCSNNFAQVSITANGIAFTQNFDGMGTSATAAAPAGFFIGTSWANTTTNTTQAGGTSVAVTAGGAYNYGAGPAAAATDRCLGFLTSSGYSSPRNIIYAFTNNTNTTITDILISFNYEKYRTGTRMFDWFFYHGSANNPTTAVASGNQNYPVDANTTTIVNATQISKNFTISGLSIANGSTYYLRWEYVGNMGNTNAQALGIDDFSITTTGTTVDAPPTLISTTPANNATNVLPNTNLVANFSENIAKGTGNILVKRTSNNTVAATVDVTSAAVSVNLAAATITLPSNLAYTTAYYVEIPASAFTDLALNPYAGISNNSTWAFTTIAAPAQGVIGSNYSFTNCATNFTTEGFTKFSVTGTAQWNCVTGRTGGTDNAIQMNAFVAVGNNPLNEDWLISPPFNLTTANQPTLKFYSITNFTGNNLELKVSTNYTPYTNPNNATWTDLNGLFPAQNSNAWTLSEEIDLSAYNTNNVHIAWVYKNPTTANSSRWSIDDITVSTNIVLPPCDEPTDQPTALTLTAAATTTNGNFTAPAIAPTGYLVVRSTSATLTNTPTDGTNYTVGTALGGGTVIAKTADVFFTDNGLMPTTTYYYFVFAFNNDNCSGGPNYNVALSNPPTGNTNNTTTLALAPCVTPTLAPTALALSPTNSAINGSFTTSTTANKYLVVISTNSNLGASPANTTVYPVGSALGNGTVVAYNNTNTFNVTNLTANTTYYIFVFAANDDCTGAPAYLSTSLSGNTITLAGTGAPANYYTTTTGLTCQDLKTELRNIISANYTTLSYTPGIWNLYYFSDKRRNDANTADIVWDMYSDNPTGPEPYTYTLGTNQCGQYSNEGDCYNREHSTPQSWFNSASPMVSDAHHIFATDGKVNAIRNSYPYGVVTNASTTTLNGSKLGTGPTSNFGYTGTVFEPRNEYKGDFARACLYMAVRYENEIISGNWAANGSGGAVFLSTTDQPDATKRRLQIYDDWFLKQMVKWHQEDPVSQKEIDRNNAIFSQLVADGGQKKQGNRNPFVDRPDFAQLIWGSANGCTFIIPFKLESFTATQQNNTITISWVINQATDVARFVVERSTDGVNFSSAQQIANNNNKNYSITENTPATKTYYRLKIITNQGTVSYSAIATVNPTQKNSFSLYPNPTSNTVQLFLNNSTATAQVAIVSTTGSVVLQQQINTALPNGLVLNTKTLASGTYMVKVTQQNITTVKKLIIVK